VTLSSNRLCPAVSGRLLPLPANSSLVFHSSFFLLLPPVALSSHVSALASYRPDPAILSFVILYTAVPVQLLYLSICFSSPSSVLGSFPLKYFPQHLPLPCPSSLTPRFYTRILTTVLYILILAALEISLDVSILFSELIPLLLLLILLSTFSSSSLS
jgi:hypothetical protein